MGSRSGAERAGFDSLRRPASLPNARRTRAASGQSSPDPGPARMGRTRGNREQKAEIMTEKIEILQPSFLEAIAIYIIYLPFHLADSYRYWRWKAGGKK